ncbi:MAG: hypothetical protein KatS3mg059_0317 [Thermomicrobiales bacterium]|nr:MAG: hypothetical protein KatS3mg059_0317 [Thermomicrobiales bacterium]
MAALLGTGAGSAGPMPYANGGNTPDRSGLAQSRRQAALLAGSVSADRCSHG